MPAKFLCQFFYELLDCWLCRDEALPANAETSPANTTELAGICADIMLYDNQYILFESGPLYLLQNKNRADLILTAPYFLKYCCTSLGQHLEKHFDIQTTNVERYHAKLDYDVFALKHLSSRAGPRSGESTDTVALFVWGPIRPGSSNMM